MTESVQQPSSRNPVWPMAATALTPLQSAFVPQDRCAVFRQPAALARRAVGWNSDDGTAIAARLIRGPHQPYPAFIASMKVHQSFTQLNWNLQRDRQLIQGGASVLAKACELGDVAIPPDPGAASNDHPGIDR